MGITRRITRPDMTQTTDAGPLMRCAMEEQHQRLKSKMSKRVTSTVCSVQFLVCSVPRIRAPSELNRTVTVGAAEGLAAVHVVKVDVPSEVAW